MDSKISIKRMVASCCLIVFCGTSCYGGRGGSINESGPPPASNPPTPEESSNVLDLVPSVAPDPNWNGDWEWQTSVSYPDCPQIKQQQTSGISRWDVNQDCRNLFNLNINVPGAQILDFQCKIGDNLFATRISLQVTMEGTPLCVGTASFSHFLELNKENPNEVNSTMTGPISIAQECYAGGQTGPLKCTLSASVEGTRMGTLSSESLQKSTGAFSNSYDPLSPIIRTLTDSMRNAN